MNSVPSWGRNSEIGNREAVGAWGIRALPRPSVQLLTTEHKGMVSSVQEAARRPLLGKARGECLVKMVKVNYNLGF